MAYRNHRFDSALPVSGDLGAYRVKDFCEAFGIGKSKFYQEVAAGKIVVSKVGRCTLIARESAKAWLTASEIKR